MKKINYKKAILILKQINKIETQIDKLVDFSFNFNKKTKQSWKK